MYAARLAEPGSALTRTTWLLRLAPLWVSVVALLLYLPSAVQIVQLSPDMVEHVDIAWRLLDGQGYALGIKAYHLGGREVVHDGLLHRGPLLTIVLAALFSVGLDLHQVQAVHAVVGAVAAGLVCSIGTVLFGQRVGIVAGLLAATNAWAFKMQVPLMTEALMSVLMLVAVRITIGNVMRPTVRSFALAGFFFGLGYLARPPALVVLVATAAVLPFVVRNWRVLVGPMCGLFAGAALTVVPMTAFSLWTRGRLIYLGKTYLFAVTDDRTVIEEGFAQDVPSAGDFIAQNFWFILDSIAGLAVTYARWIFLDPELLLVLLPGWFFVAVALWHGRYQRRIWIPLAAAAANFAFYVLMWSTSQDRYLLPTVLLLLPIGTDGLLRGLDWVGDLLRGALGGRVAHTTWRTAVAGLLVVGAATLWLPEFLEQYRGDFAYFDRPVGSRTDAGIRWTGPPRWVNDDDFWRVVTWAESRAQPDTVMALGQPWPLGLFSRQPVLMLPVNLDERTIRRFVVEYQVTEILVDGRDVRRRRYRHYLEDLEPAGVTATKLGAVTAFDTRRLWQ